MRIAEIIKNILPYGISDYLVRKKMILKSRKEPPSSKEPPVYNADGQKLKTIYLSDDNSSHFPYCFVSGRYPRHILWDRNNFGLKNHVYSHKKILTPIGSPERKFALLMESEAIVPDDFRIFSKYKGLEKDFDLIFTHSGKMLDKYKNAVFVPASGVWYGTELWGGKLNPIQCEQKTKNISMLSSNKNVCDFHRFRIGLAKYYKTNKKVDTYGNFDGGETIELSVPLATYRYSVIIENEISPFYFTEKILNCFAAMTIPIYIGAAQIAGFFNIDGIIQVKKPDYESVDKIIAVCNEQDYSERIPAIIDNYNRVQNYLCIEDYMWDKYHGYFV